MKLISRISWLPKAICWFNCVYAPLSLSWYLTITSHENYIFSLLFSVILQPLFSGCTYDTCVHFTLLSTPIKINFLNSLISEYNWDHKYSCRCFMKFSTISLSVLEFSWIFSRSLWFSKGLLILLRQGNMNSPWINVYRTIHFYSFTIVLLNLYLFWLIYS